MDTEKKLLRYVARKKMEQRMHFKPFFPEVFKAVGEDYQEYVRFLDRCINEAYWLTKEELKQITQEKEFLEHIIEFWEFIDSL